MEPLQTLQRVEALYRRVLELTLEQEEFLKSSALAALPHLLAEKNASLAEAQALTADVQRDAHALSTPECQSVLAGVAAVLKQMMEAEERCRNLVPGQAPRPNRAAAAAAYGKISGPR